MKKFVVCICIMAVLASTFSVSCFSADLAGAIEDTTYNMSKSAELAAGSDSVSEPAIKPISGHPRVFLTPEYIKNLKLYIQTEEIRPAWNVVKSITESTYNSELSENTSGNYDADIVNWVQCRALVYALGEEDANWAKDTILHATNVLRTVTFDENKSDVTREKGTVMVMGAVVYDWCYDQMTDSDKNYFIKRFKEICATKEIGYPPKDDLGSTGGHNGEYEIRRDMLSCGIACYDEDPEMYNYAAGIVFSKFAASRKLFNSSGNHPQGSAYGRFRLGCELYAELLFSRMGYPSVYGEEIENVILRYIYARRPDGMILKDSDDYVYRNRTKSEYYNTEEWYSLILLNAIYDNPYVRGQFIKDLSINGYSPYAFWLVVCADPNKPYKTEDDLPTAYKTTYPLTSVFHRTSWESGSDSDVAMAQFKANEINIGDHMHLDTGAFQIYYKGALAIDSGYYESGSEHSLNYDKRTVAHNLVTVYDPNEKFTAYSGKEYANDGGQKFNKQLYAKDYEYMMSEDCHYADTKGTYIGPNAQTPAFSYLKTDLSPAYSDKIKSYNRSMVFLDLFDEDYPAAFVVFDNVTSSDKTFDKKWLLHSIEEPVVEANTTVISRTENGYGGKLVNKTLMPSAFNIEKVGGEGKEFWVDGNNYSVSDISPNHSEKGSWRIELSPENESENDVFLNAMYVTDNDKNLPELPMYKESMSGFVGVTVKDRMVMFSENANTQTEDFSLTVRENGYNEVTCLIADVEEGIWNISGNGTNVYAVSSSGEEVICFKAKPGSYTVSKVDEVPDDDAEPEVGPWIADFSEMTSEVGKQLENNGCYLNMAYTNNWIYDSEADYVNTNAQSADLRIGEQYAEDYTIGFKMNAQTQGNL
ncbi:MAG: heparinase II/III family protein, partial [Clostridia bacterium]|nr:heparinase II/III family protein [Clostridia bacterium]